MTKTELSEQQSSVIYTDGMRILKLYGGVWGRLNLFSMACLNIRWSVLFYDSKCV